MSRRLRRVLAMCLEAAPFNLEKQAQDYILVNIRNAINTKRNIISKLYDLIETKQELKVREFFEGYYVTPPDVYSKKVRLWDWRLKRFTQGLSGRCREGTIAGFSVGKIVFAEFQALD